MGIICMKCVINLFDDDKIVEIVTDIPKTNIIALSKFQNRLNWSSEELVDDIIEQYIKSRGL